MNLRFSSEVQKMPPDYLMLLLLLFLILDVGSIVWPKSSKTFHTCTLPLSFHTSSVPAVPTWGEGAGTVFPCVWNEPKEADFLHTTWE